MLLPIAVLLLVTLQVTESSAETCTFSRSSAQITCGSISCTAVRPGWLFSFTSDLLPPGHYRIGPVYYPYKSGERRTWYDLYPYSDGNYWDYHSGVPRLDCRRGFALHNGERSRGCITLTDTCMGDIANYLNQLPSNDFTVNQCNACFGYNCWGSRCRCGVGTLTASYIGTLYVY